MPLMPRARQERKFAAVLFADLVGSTSLAEQADPEVVQSVVGRAFDGLAQVIERYGGHLEKFMGDAVLAVFGAPLVHEDDPERAVRAALEIQAVLSELNRDFAAEGKPQLIMRIGIEAGEVLVDLDRVAGPRDRMVTGDAVNTAARLQAAAEPGRVIVGPAVYMSTRVVVDFRELPPLTLKGKAEPVPAWEALRVKSRRPERAPLGLEAKLIGRDEELALLKQTFHRMQSEGRPALITVLGPAGAGKSRLALELFRYLEGLAQPVIWRKGRCLAYGNVSYSALAEAVKVECQILEDDPPETVGLKVSRAVEELFGDPALAPHIEVLVGSGREHHFSREDLFDAWRRFLERMAARKALVLTMEDIHWADDGLLDFIDHLADWAQGPILILALARAELLERRPGWGGGKRNYSAIYLEPLTRKETEAMVEDLLSTRLPDELTQVVVDRSDGNPLFVEEIIRMFVDRGVIRAEAARWDVVRPVEQVEVPRSIQALIAARLDSLPSEEKAIVQDAAVVGRAFWLGAVQRLSGRSQREAQEALNRLRLKGLVVTREPPTFSGELEFAFRHALIRDVAYESLPKSLRADRHVEVAGWAEEQAGERREEIAELLATHYLQALRFLDELGEINDRRDNVERKGFRWAKAAADRALRLWQQREAVRWFRTALELAGRIGLPKQEQASLWEWYARAGEEAEPYQEVAQALEHALALFDEVGNERDASRVQARLAWVAFLSGREEEVLPRAERAIARLEALGESRDLAIALHVRGWYMFRRVRYDEAERDLRRAIEMADRVGDQVTRGHAMVSLAFVFQQTGRGKECIALFEDALELARRAGDLSLLLRAQLHICGALEEILGEYRRAEALVREGLELARRTGNVGNIGWMEVMLSDQLFEMGKLEESERAARNGLEASRAVGEPLVVGYALERIALIHALRGQLEEAEQSLEELRPIVQENPEPWIQGWPPLVAGLVAQGRGREEEAARILAEGARPLLGRLFVYGGKSLLLECVRSLVRVGRAAEALPFRDRLQRLAASSTPARAFLAWADGLLEPEPDKARALLADAARQLEALEHRVEVGRCLIDVAQAEHRLRIDPTPTLARAREILVSSGATLFLREVNAAPEST